MISRKGIESGGTAAAYFDKAFQQDGNGRNIDNYYLNEQAAARWQGRGAQILGIEGKSVSRVDFVAFLDGKMPVPGTNRIQDLADNSLGDKRRAGQDFTVSPPKSVSVLALVGRDERVLEAHQRANDVAMKWFERHAAVVRVRDGTGREALAKQTGNLLWATVTHETDRSNMPQLHNHNVIIAAVYDQESERWRSLTNDELLKIRTAGDLVYKRELGHQLRQAGYQLEMNSNGVDFEVKGFSSEQIARFSRRSEEIDDALRAKGIDPETASYEARQAAALDSREAKVDLPREELQKRWSEAEKIVGLRTEEMVTEAKQAALEGRSNPAEQDVATAKEAMHAVAWAVEHHAEREQAFKETDLALTALKFSPSLRIEPVESAIAKLEADGGLVDRGVDKQGARLLTTPRGRSVEITLAENLAAARGRGNVIVSGDREFNTRLATYEADQSAERGKPFKLSAEQVAAAKNVLMDGDAVQGIQGEAGTGKTAALAFVRVVAQDKGWRVLGMATSSSAADELGRSSGIESSTVASFFAKQENQIRVVREELSALSASFNAQTDGKLGQGTMVEFRRVGAEGADTESGSRAYSFDHKRGVVFRMNNGLMGAAGVRLLDFSQDARDRATNRQGGPESIGQSLASRAEALGGRAAEWVGLRLADFQRVDGAEAVSVRKSLAEQTGNEQQRLARRIGLKRAELRNLESYGDGTGRRTLLVMDETSLTGAADLASVTSVARSIGARAVLQGDTKQHSSPAAGRAFMQAQSFGMHTSILRETMRFTDASDQVKAAHEQMQRGNFGEAYSKLDTRIVEGGELAETVAKRYVALLAESGAAKIEPGLIGVAALTNFDRKAANAAIHVELQRAGVVDEKNFEKMHLERPKLTQAEHHFASALQASGVTHLAFARRNADLGLVRGSVLQVTGFDSEKNLIHATTETGRKLEVDTQRHEGFSAMIGERRQFAAGDRVEAREVIRTTGEMRSKISNGSRGRIEAIDDGRMVVHWDDGRTMPLSNKQARAIDHAYARTTFKEQGATNRHEIIMISNTGAKIFNKEAAYVGATRAKVNTEVITSDHERLLKNAGNDVSKQTALRSPEMKELVEQARAQKSAISQTSQNQREAQKPQKIQELTRD